MNCCSTRSWPRFRYVMISQKRPTASIGAASAPTGNCGIIGTVLTFGHSVRWSAKGAMGGQYSGPETMTVLVGSAVG